jgi:hypothetical protein
MRVDTSAAWFRSLRWFMAELIVVVAGVLIALSAQRWWQAREDSARESAYMTQLVSDIRQTEAQVAAIDSASLPALMSSANLLRGYRARVKPPRDSLLLWASSSVSYNRVLPVMATAEALISTGDVRIVSDDSVRMAIYDYVAASRDFATEQDRFVDIVIEGGRRLGAHVDFMEAVIARLGPAIDSIAIANPGLGLQAGERLTPFPVDEDEFWRTREIYESFLWINLAHQNLLGARRVLRVKSAHARSILERELNDE